MLKVRVNPDKEIVKMVTDYLREHDNVAGEHIPVISLTVLVDIPNIILNRMFFRC